MNTREFFPHAVPNRHRRSLGAFSGAGLILAALLSACATDAQLLNENRAAALQAAVRQSARDLNCDQTAGAILSDGEVPGTPLGDLWSLYTIKATGCGKALVYIVECENKTVCSVKPDARK